MVSCAIFNASCERRTSPLSAALLATGQYMARTLPDAELVVIENVGHCPHLSAPGASTDAIDAFLAKRGL
jgi:sigma-B regulation protein RsbQ